MLGRDKRCCLQFVENVQVMFEGLEEIKNLQKEAVSHSFKFQWFEEGEKPRFVSLEVLLVNKKGKNRLCLNMED